jgi:uncharacterized membrane protein
MAGEVVRPNRFAIGCLLFLPGFFGGAMIALLVGMVIDRITGCVPPGSAAGGATVCGWERYATIGGVLGVVLLESVVLWRLRRSSAVTRNPERS